MNNFGSVTERLALNQFEPDEQTHIEVHQEAAKAAGLGPLLERVCPAHVYSTRDDGSVAVTFEACLECGTCLAVAPPGTLTWHYPRGGFGVTFREG